MEKIFADAGITSIKWDVSPQVEAVINHPDYCKVNQDVIDAATRFSEKYNKKHNK